MKNETKKHVPWVNVLEAHEEVEDTLLLHGVLDHQTEQGVHIHLHV